MRKFIFKNLILFIFLLGLFGLAFNFLYNQDRVVFAQTGFLEEEKLFCEAEIPIGETIDETENFSQDIIDNLKNILNNGVSEIDNAKKLVDYTSEYSDGDSFFCDAQNCSSSMKTSSKYCSKYTCGYESCDICPPPEPEDGGNGAFKKEDFYSLIPYLNKVFQFILPDKLCKGLIPEVFAHSGDDAGCYEAPASPDCECGGGKAITCNCDWHCKDCSCTTCSSEFGSGPASSCPLNEINPIMNKNKDGFIKNNYQEILNSYNRLKDLIETEPNKIIRKLDKSRTELKKCTTTKADYYETLEGEKPEKATLTCKDIKDFIKGEIPVTISGKDTCYENNYYCCE